MLLASCRGVHIVRSKINLSNVKRSLFIMSTQYYNQIGKNRHGNEGIENVGEAADDL